MTACSPKAARRFMRALRKASVLTLVGAITVFVMAPVFFLDPLRAETIDVIAVAKIGGPTFLKTIVIPNGAPDVEERLSVWAQKFDNIGFVNGGCTLEHFPMRRDYNVTRLILRGTKYLSGSLVRQTSRNFPRDVSSGHIPGIYESGVARKDPPGCSPRIDASGFNSDIGSLDRPTVGKLAVSGPDQQRGNEHEKKCSESNNGTLMGVGDCGPALQKRWAPTEIDTAILGAFLWGGFLAAIVGWFWAFDRYR
jgi:hypothetical protein